MSSSSSALAASTPRRERSTKQRALRWTRILHVYTSMICLLVVLFFSVTGLTLNHPNWTLGAGSERATAQGALPAGWSEGGSVDWLAVAEYLRDEHGLRGKVVENDNDDQQGSITFKGPGYAADAFFQMADGSYELTVETQGALAVVNDLHKGRDSASSWRWLIDVSAGFLVAISLTGLGLQLFLKARRRSALITAFGGSVLFALFFWVALR